MNVIKRLLLGTSFVFIAAMLYLWGHLNGTNGTGLTGEAFAQSTSEITPVEAREREVYYPNSEDLDPDEMRVIACGTGMRYRNKIQSNFPRLSS